MTDFVIGTRGWADGYEGVIRKGRKVIVACGHHHPNRDMSTKTNGQSARDCVTMLVRAARNHKVRDRVVGDILGGPRAYARTWSATSGTLARMTEAAQKQAIDFQNSLPGIAEALADEPVLGYLGHLAVAPKVPAPSVCRWCRNRIEADVFRLYRREWWWRAPGPTTWSSDHPCTGDHRHEPEDPAK